MMLTPRWRRPSDFRMSKPTLISSTGSAARRHADGVADPGPQHVAHADGRLDRAGAQGPGLGHAQVQRAVDGLGQLLIGGDGQEGVGRLHRDLELVEVVVLQDAGVVQGALDHGVGAGLAVFLQQFLLQRAGVDADAHGAAMVLGRLNDVADAVGRADIAGIDAQAGGARLGRLDAALVVKMDVGHERHLGTRARWSGRRRSIPRRGRRRGRCRPRPLPADGSAPMVAAASDVGVLVIDWTVIGASPPTGTLPTMIWRLLRRSIWRHGRM